LSPSRASAFRSVPLTSRFSVSPNSYGFDAPEGGLAQRAQQVAQRPVAEEVDALLGQLELDGLAGRADVAATARVVERLVLRELQVALAYQPLDHLLEELVARLRVAHQLRQVLFREQAAAQQRLQDGVVERLEVVFVPVVHLLGAEPAVEQEVGQLRDEVLEVEVVPQLAEVAVIFRSGHGLEPGTA